MLKPKQIRREELKPELLWNIGVDMAFMGEKNEMNEHQKAVHFVFEYEGEVQNGGHMQYFENKGISHIPETLQSLKEVGGSCQFNILENATKLWIGKSRKAIETNDIRLASKVH